MDKVWNTDVHIPAPPKVKCAHKWIDMEDGSLDKFCVRCSNKVKQAMAYLPTPEIRVEISIPSISITGVNVDDMVKRMNDEIAKRINDQIVNNIGNDPSCKIITR